jgi:glycosyltransferase involved in cell wall biosynthesis
MKVCFLLEDFYPLVHGASVQTILLSKRFLKGGARVSVVTRRLSKEHSARDVVAGIDVFRVSPAVGVSRLGKYLMLLPAFFQLILIRKSFDILIVCDLKVLGICGVVVSKLLGKKCILNAVSCGEMDGSYATLYTDKGSRFRAGLINVFIATRNLFIKRADAFLGISTAIMEEFVRCGVPPSKAYKIYCGVDTKIFRSVSLEEKNELRQKLELDLNGRYYVYTGRLIWGKGLEHLINAWSRLANERSDVYLMFVGSGQGHSLSCEEFLQREAEANGLSDRVIFTGNVDGVCEYLQASDFFVFPSQSEGLGLSLIEALACGLPSIATGVGGILDILQHGVNGILVQYGDVESLYLNMKKLLTSEKISQEYSNAGRATVESNFDIDKLAIEYFELFSQLESA